MKKIVIIGVLMSGLLVGGCGQKKITDSDVTTKKSTKMSSETSQSQVTTETSHSSESSTTVEKEVKSTNLWNADKGKKLADFMLSWGQTMKQDYQEYSPTNNVDLYGLQLPKTVLERLDNWQAVVNDVPISLAWSDNGKSDAEYTLVAVFSDADSQPYMQKHVYFFTLVSGEPKVLVTSQNQGNNDNYLYFKETDNIELKNGFAAIVADE
ncbi:hypothetical protein CBF34_03725 [Vagococcus penaei]|uniref:Uncharacterized protein n=1 Tax=Vagococcus penaei TaxID=633807 RepID=A0A1Q2D892_9ENTE|nr:DUF4767 domain-containing protein [Vagococcus penaei]AQP54648.1 hypothetical protein BW732_10820 [Vagococcus penaei]RSU05300.1 hypothetical protein CBF34_03725 [Vagococcus penaei]